MSAYYNEHDPKAAAWLRELIKQGHIAQGVVDERSIEDVKPSDIKSYTQCHFFAGIGVWSYALRKAGWPDDRPVWTGSCPCQPFSAAGKAGGFADERHLWPHFHYLIEQCDPRVVFGEQVASKDGLAWLDLVQADMEATNYAFGAVDLCAAGVGAPHIRQRLWFVAERVADTAGDRCSGQGSCATVQERREQGQGVIGQLQGRFKGCTIPDPQQADAGGMAYSNDRGEHALLRGKQDHTTKNLRSGEISEPHGSMARRDESESERLRGYSNGAPSPTNGFWQDADWLGCMDGKWRPVSPGTFPLVDGAPARVGRLRGYGNAINAEAATEVIRSYMTIDSETAQ